MGGGGGACNHVGYSIQRNGLGSSRRPTGGPQYCVRVKGDNTVLYIMESKKDTCHDPNLTQTAKQETRASSALGNGGVPSQY